MVRLKTNQRTVIAASKFLTIVNCDYVENFSWFQAPSGGTFYLLEARSSSGEIGNISGAKSSWNVKRMVTPYTSLQRLRWITINIKEPRKICATSSREIRRFSVKLLRYQQAPGLITSGIRLHYGRHLKIFSSIKHAECSYRSS